MLEYNAPRHLVTKSTSPEARTTEMDYDAYGNRTAVRPFYTETHAGAIPVLSAQKLQSQWPGAYRPRSEQWSRQLRKRRFEKLVNPLFRRAVSRSWDEPNYYSMRT
jgi:YD repeat-containing protein